MYDYISEEALLEMLEHNLEIEYDYMDAESVAKLKKQLMNYIQSSKEYIQTEGIVLEDTVGDAMLVSMYAGWLYDKRKAISTSGMTNVNAQQMPRMIRWNLNNRLFHQKVNEDAV